MRYENTKSLPLYLKGDFVSYKENITDKELKEYFLITNLRLEKGFLKDEYRKTFGADFIDDFGDKISANKLEGYFNLAGDYVSLNDEGIILMDFILFKIL